MLRTYLLTAFRSLKKNPGVSAINLIGLSLSLGCALVAFLMVEFHYTQDNFHVNRDRIFLVTNLIDRSGEIQHWADSPLPIGPALKKDLPEVYAMSRLHLRGGTIRHNGETFEEGVEFLDEEFFRMFSFPFKYGNANGFDKSNSVILSSQAAEKYFGAEDPTGKSLEILFEGKVRLSFEVIGVLEKFPINSSLEVQIAVPFDRATQAYADFNPNDWRGFASATFVQLNDPSDTIKVNEQLEKYLKIQNEANKDWMATGFPIVSLIDLFLKNEHMLGGVGAQGDILGVKVLMILALFMVLLACFNYINIAVATGATRLKEMGIRKVLGGQRISLILQFLIENLVTVFLAMVLGVLLGIAVFVPAFESMFSVGLTFTFKSLWFWMYFFGTIFFTGILSGAYPAFYISSFSPTSIFRGKQKVAKNRFTKVFLSFQFILAVLCMSGGIAFTMNTQYQQNRDWGYTREPLLAFHLEGRASYDKFRKIAEEDPDIIEMAGSAHHIGSQIIRSIITVGGEKKEAFFAQVSDGYTDMMKLRLKEGRMIDPALASDRSNVVVNETFLKAFDVKGDFKDFVFYDDSIRHQIVGVVEDFHFMDFWNPIEPFYMYVAPEDKVEFLIVKASPGRAQAVLDRMKLNWSALFPDAIFNGRFQEQFYDDYFQVSRGHAKLMIFVATLSVLLSCMGLFGLVSYNIAFRMKEFSLRKILGAMPRSLFMTMAKPYLVLLASALLLGIPLTQWAIFALMDEVYIFHMDPTILPVITGGVLLVVMAALTVAILFRKIQRSSPVDALRES